MTPIQLTYHLPGVPACHQVIVALAFYSGDSA
jgi:hypothetical protein